jgi:hypothetical protein
MIPKASEDLYGYKKWLNSLVPLEVGTVIKWTKGYNEDTVANTIKPGQFTKVVKVRKSNGVSDMPAHSQGYTLRVCNKYGKEFKKQHFWRVEGIACRLDLKEIEVI